jgi:hypothetical protein
METAIPSSGEQNPLPCTPLQFPEVNSDMCLMWVHLVNVELGCWKIDAFLHIATRDFRTGSSVIRMETCILVAGTEFTYVSDLEQTNGRCGTLQDD